MSISGEPAHRSGVARPEPRPGPHPDPRPEPRPVERRGERREELLVGLRELFLAEGFLAFGVGNLAERLRCSRTTLYQVAPTKEQIVLHTVRAWFRDATVAIEAAVAEVDDPVARIETYLRAVARGLAPASPQFHADLASYAPAREIYRRNTELAGERVQSLVAEGVDQGRLRSVDAVFVGAVVARVMSAIQSGEITRATGLDDAAAYEHLAQLLIRGLRDPAADFEAGGAPVGA
jgi:AcrR family transcriptional regulator